jgi:pimeloyl-ACP methyl ester carboxylesterase
VPTRRALLIGGGVAAIGSATGLVAVDRRLLPGRSALRDALGLNGPAGVVPDAGPARVEFGEFTSSARGGVPTGYAIITPSRLPGAESVDLPVVLGMHQHGGTHRSLAGGFLHLERFLQAHVDAGGTPFVIVAADGGNDYWHPRPDGTDPAGMLTDEFLPMLAERGLRTAGTDRIGLIGWSMGGYGALHLAGTLGVGRIAAVVAVSPALWVDPDDASVSGFIDATEYAAFSVFGRQSGLARIPVRVDCGDGDVFVDAVRSYSEGLADDAVVTIGAGDHDERYWHRVLPEQLAFLGRSLAAE